MIHEADAGITELAENANNASWGDDKLFVQFSYRPVKDEAASLEEGRPIYKDAEYVKIMVPGDKSTVIERPVRDVDKHRFARQYAAFKNNESQEVQGTPLAEWPQITRSQVEELKHFGVVTVEQLADVPDSTIGHFMGLAMLKSKAQAFMEAARNDAPVQKMKAELEERDRKIEVLEQNLQALLEKIDSEDKPRRGRPRKGE